MRSALNLGLALATGEVVVMIDGDTLLEESTISTIAAPFADPVVGAVSGNPKIGNPDRFLSRLQASEYLVAWSLERRLLAPAGMITMVPGAIGAWRRSAVREAGFVSTDTFAEDTDLTIAVARGVWRVKCAPNARGKADLDRGVAWSQGWGGIASDGLWRRLRGATPTRTSPRSRNRR